MANAKVVAAKAQEVERLTEKFQNSSSAVVVCYEGITVADDTALRKTLREAGIYYTVSKNTMTNRALVGLGYNEFGSVLNGMTAVAFCPDEVSAAKILKEYDDKIKTFEIRAGICEGKALNRDEVLALASTPSKNELIAKFLGSIKSPLYKFAAVIDAVAEKKSESAEAPAEAPAETPAE